MIELLENQKKINELEISIMNSSFYISISNSEILDWKEIVSSYLLYFEHEFSRFSKENELWRFNQLKKNSTVTVSTLFYDLLKKSEEYRIKTGGRFSPYLLSQLECHGYKHSFPFQSVSNEKGPVPYYHIEHEPLTFHGENTITKNTPLKIDLGGIAKGYAVEAVARWLQVHARSHFGIVDGGGDIQVWSNGQKTWEIGIMNPFHEHEEIGSFQVQNGGIATSNTVYRSWYQNGKKKHHIFDGRTGEPTHSNMVQATVVSRSCLDAEIGAKICFMDEHESILQNLHHSFNYVLVQEDGKIIIGGSRNEC